MPRQKRARDADNVEDGAADPGAPPLATAEGSTSNDVGNEEPQEPATRRSKRARTTAAPTPATRVQPTRARKGASANTATAESAKVTKAAATPRARAERKKKAPTNPSTEATEATTSTRGTNEVAPVAGTSQSAITSTVISSSTDAPATSSSRGKGKKKATGAGASRAPTEKRLAPFRSHPPVETISRREKAMKQRFFMLDRQREGEELREQFHILGSTQNVYTVVIDHKPRCDCPDARWGHHCKHIMFVYFRVLQVSENSSLWYQKALLTSELETIFSNAPLAPNSLAHSHIRNAFNQATGKAPVQDQGTSEPQNDKRRIPGPDDDCPICYETMHEVAESKLEFCHTCGNALHSACFDQWKGSNAFRHTPLTCVWCRSPWVLPQSKGQATSDKSAFYSGAGGADLGNGVRRTYNGYLNLAGVAQGM